MSDQLPAVAAAPDTIQIDGKDYRMTPLTLADFAEMSRHVMRLMANPIAALSGQLKHFSAEERRELMATAVEAARQQAETASIGQITEFSRTWEGLCFTFRLLVRRDHPEVKTDEQAGEILACLDEAGQELLMQAINDMSSSADSTAKNSKSPVQITETEKEPHESRGLGSISN